MYVVENVSDYNAAVIQPVQRHALRMLMNNWEYSEANLLEGTLVIKNQCSSSTELTIGSAFIGQMQCTFLNTFIQGVAKERGTWVGTEIEVISRLRTRDSPELDANNYDDVPMGIYTVAEAKRTPMGVEIVAYDNMSKFDKTLSLIDSEGAAAGTIFELATMACNECNVTLGMTQTECNALPNGLVNFELYEEHDLKTWRDFIAALAALCGGYATIDRLGQLVFRSYGNAGSAVATFSPTLRYNDNLQYSDYVTAYNGITITYDKETQTKTFNNTATSGTTLDLGANPFLQTAGSNIDNIANAILSAIATVAYTPFSATIVDPRYDFGDIIEFTDGIAGMGLNTNKVTCCVMGYVWSYKRGYTIQGFGENPTFAQSSTARSVGASNSSSSSVGVQYIFPTNINESAIVDGAENVILTFEFSAYSDSYVLITAQININIETTVSNDVYTDCNVDIIFELDETEVETLTQTYFDGQHILTINYMLPIKQNGEHMLNIVLAPTGGIIS